MPAAALVDRAPATGVVPATVRAIDGLLDAAVLSLAWWTVVYQVAIPVDMGRDLAGAVWLAGTLVAVGWVVRAGATAPRRFLALRSMPWGPTLAALAATTAAAVISATRWSAERPEFWLVWGLVVAGCAAALRAVLGPDGGASAGETTSADGGATGGVDAGGRATGGPRDRPTARPTGLAVAVVLGLAVLAAIGSAVTVRPDADDVFLVNRSTYVEQHRGPLPDRDTIYSDEVFAASRPEVPGTAVESLLGVVAAWTPLRAPTIVYLVFGPAVAFLMVPALWRMLRTLGAAAPAAATAVACGFLLLDGGTHYTFGNFSFARSWQGKAAFLVVVVPALWHHGLRWGRDGSRRDVAMLAAAGIAGVGLTTTAAFVGPAVAAVAVAGGVIATGAWRRLTLGALAAAPAAVAALAFTIAPRQDATPALGTLTVDRLGSAVGSVLGATGRLGITFTEGINPGRQWHWIYHGGIGMLVATGAALAAWTLVTDRAARIALVLAPLLLFGFFYGPGTFDAIAEISGVRSILWRSGWLLPVPAAVGLLGTVPLLVRRHPRPLRAAASGGVCAVLAGAMLLGEPTVLDPDNRGITVGRPAWDVDPASSAAAARLVELSEPGDVVASPVAVGGALAIRTTEVRPVNARNQYLTGRHAVDEFRGPQRELVSRAMARGIDPVEAGALADALDALSVDVACVSTTVDDVSVAEALTTAGFAPISEGEGCVYWSR